VPTERLSENAARRDRHQKAPEEEGGEGAEEERPIDVGIWVGAQLKGGGEVW